MFNRGKKTGDDSVGSHPLPDESAWGTADPAPLPAPEGVRSEGPWDASEKNLEGERTYIDLGALIIRGRTGINFQLPTDNDGDTIGSVVVLTDDSALELRAFAAQRSGGLWDEVRTELAADVTKREGQVETVEGVFGPELRVRLPATLPSGDAGIQPSRVVGIEGPRWMLRATFLGKAGLEPSDEGLLFESLRDTIVRRGTAPMAPRDPLLLTAPRATPRSEDEPAEGE